MSVFCRARMRRLRPAALGTSLTGRVPTLVSHTPVMFAHVRGKVCRTTLALESSLGRSFRRVQTICPRGLLRNDRVSLNK